MLRFSITPPPLFHFHLISNASGSAILFVLVVAVILNLLIGAVSFGSRYTIKGSSIRREKISALNFAEAGKERFYARLIHEGYTPTSNSRTVIYDNESFGNGFYTVQCSTGTDIDTMNIYAQGNDGANKVRIEVVSVKKRSISLIGMDAKAKAAITSRANTDLLGNIIIDGRDYDSLNLLTGLPGVYGIYTCLTMSLDNNAATIGGNGIEPVDDDDLPLVRSTVSLENAPILTEFNSPEAFLGLPENSLDDYKIDPDDLPLPFNGFYYVTGSIGPIHFGESRGVLIVHNESFSAELFANTGTFKGLIICDKLNKLNGGAVIIGAVGTLATVSAPISGNGSAEVHYSTQVLSNLTDYCQNIKWKIEEVAWREIP